MLKKPFEFITEFYKEKVDRDRKNNEFIYTQTDSLISWIIGFAFTGLLLIIGNIKTLELNSRTPTKPIIICILITIVLGIAFRYISFLIITFEKNLDDYYFGLFSKHEMTPFEVDSEVENDSFDKVLIRLKEDFNETINYPDPLNDEMKARELPQLKEHYKKLCAHSRKSLDIAMGHIANIEFDTHRIDKKKNIDLFNQALKNNINTGYNAGKWEFFRSLFFTLCLLAFLTGIFIACFSLLFM
ncbi:MAG TPA: hypothetical protein VIY47_14725 [Ignavibacteriaceae bacterium]